MHFSDQIFGSSNTIVVNTPKRFNHNMICGLIVKNPPKISNSIVGWIICNYLLLLLHFYFSSYFLNNWDVFKMSLRSTSRSIARSLHLCRTSISKHMALGTNATRENTCVLQRGFFTSPVTASSQEMEIRHIQKNVPKNIQFPEYALSGEPGESPHRLRIYTADEIVKCRRAGRLARKMLDFANKLAVVPDKYTTSQIDELTREEMLRHGAYPSPLNYRGFPKSICTSVNEVVCHGIPDDRLVKKGDKVSIDVSLFIDGFHGDNCGTVISGGGNPNNARDKRSLKLIQATSDALERAIVICKPGACISTIGATIDVVANHYGFKVVQEFCGHGTGELLHMPPFVRHFKNNYRFPMEPGMVFTIEPILVESSRRITTWDDGWSAATLDGGWGAQFEHEVLITENGYEVLTLPE